MRISYFVPTQASRSPDLNTINLAPPTPSTERSEHSHTARVPYIRLCLSICIILYLYIYTTHTQLLSCGYMLILLYSIYWNNNNAGKLFKTTKQQWCSVTKNIALKMNQTKLGEWDGLWHWLYDITNNIRSGKLTAIENGHLFIVDLRNKHCDFP